MSAVWKDVLACMEPNGQLSVIKRSPAEADGSGTQGGRKRAHA